MLLGLLRLFKASGRAGSIALVSIGALVLIFAAIGAASVFIVTSSTQPGEIVARHVREIHSLENAYDADNTTINGVQVSAGGSTQLSEQTGLVAATASATLPAAVTVEQDSNGQITRVEYQGSWYGTEPSDTALLIFCGLLAALGLAGIFFGVIRLPKGALPDRAVLGASGAIE
jgi:hypothetical protein